MADRFPLVFNTSSNQIQELSASDNLDLSSSGLVKVASIGATSVNVTGVVTATDFNATSDLSLKTNIKSIEDPISKVLEINGVSFDWKESGKASIGVIAQEVEKVLPELVSDQETKTVNYNGLVGLLIEAVKNQQTQIDELKKQINQ